jgi:hypothetical protein
VAVFVDKSTEDVDSFDSPNRDETRWRRLTVGGRHAEVEAAVWSGGVVVPDVGGHAARPGHDGGVVGHTTDSYHRTRRSTAGQRGTERDQRPLDRGLRGARHPPRHGAVWPAADAVRCRESVVGEFAGRIR